MDDDFLVTKKNLVQERINKINEMEKNNNSEQLDINLKERPKTFYVKGNL